MDDGITKTKRETIFSDTKSKEVSLKLDHLSLPLLVTSQLKVLGPLDGDLKSVLACAALQTKDQLLGGLGLKFNKNVKISEFRSKNSDVLIEKTI